MKSPFKFLDSFTKEDKAIFFGRDRETEELYQKVFDSKILLVYGVSGTGKSSLIHCGLANKFQDSDWLPINIRRGGNINESLVNGLNKFTLSEDCRLPTADCQLQTQESDKAKSSNPQQPTKPLKKLLKNLYLDHFKPIYLIFDQFEELFIFGSKTEKEEFIQSIKKIVDSEIQCKFLFVIREEYLAGITEFEKEIPTFLQNRIRIEKMTRTNAVQCIEGPCKVHGIAVEEGFSVALLEKLSPGSTDVELTYMQVFLDKVFRTTLDALSFRGVPKGTTKETAEGNFEADSFATLGMTFSLNLLSELGEVKDLLGSFLEEQIATLDDPDSALAILKSFVSVKGTKRQITEEEINEHCKTIGKNVELETFKKQIAHFVNIRILRDKDESGRYELRHDALAAKIYEKITLVEKELMEIRQFIENAFDNYQKRNVLLEASDLNYIALYEDKLFLTTGLQDFINKCKSDFENKQKTVRRISTLATLGFFLMLIVVGYFIFKKISDTSANDMAISAIFMQDEQPVAALKRAIEAYDIDSNAYTCKAVLETFHNIYNKASFTDTTGKLIIPVKQVFDFAPCESDIVSAKLSLDDKYIYGYLMDSSVMVWAITGEEILSIKMDSAKVIGVIFAADSKHFAILRNDNLAEIYDINGIKKCSFNVHLNKLQPTNSLRFSPGGKFIAYSDTSNNVIITSINGDLVQRITDHKYAITCLDFSPDSKFLASSSKDSTIMIWFNSQKTTNPFKMFEKIQKPRGIVQSVDFSNNSKYILVVADQTEPDILKLNGDRKCMIFLSNNSDKYFRVSGSFTKNDEEIIFNAYEKKNGKMTKIKHTIGIEGTPIGRVLAENFYDNGQFFSSCDFSEKTKCFTYTLLNDNKIHLVDESLFNLITLNGYQAEFQSNGEYLLCVNSNKLELYPVAIKKIRYLVFNKKIFGAI